jgi:hypothetical protein
MKNPNSPWARTKAFLKARWSSEDYPGAEPRFQIKLFGKDFGVFVLFLVAVVLGKSCNSETDSRKRTAIQKNLHDSSRLEVSKTQIIDFNKRGSGVAFGVSRKSPGSLVKVRLLNVVETYSNAPVHAQIIDEGLGRSLVGGTLIGDATSDSNFERIAITFRFARDPNRSDVAIPIAARALGLDGTLGLIAGKKEGFFARSAIGSATSVNQNSQSQGEGSSLKDILFKALTSGMMQEFGNSAQVERNRSQVLTLTPSTIFFAELTDFFPGGAK